MMLQAAINGGLSKADHPGVPVTEDELTRDVRECLMAGAREFHIHVMDADGNPTLDSGYVNRAASVVQDAEALVTCGLADRVTRVLVEPGEAQGSKNDAIPMVDAIHEILDRADVKAPRLQHGDGELTWILIEDAVRRGLDTRVGLEDTFYLPDGSRAHSNADLVTAACVLGAGAARHH